MSFHENLRSLRERLGKTQQQIADEMGIDKSTYCGYETGKRQPDVKKLKQLAAILGVSGDELLETVLAKNEPQDTAHQSNVLRLAGRDGTFLEKKLTDDQMAAIKAIVEQMPEVTDL